MNVYYVLAEDIKSITDRDDSIIKSKTVCMQITSVRSIVTRAARITDVCFLSLDQHSRLKLYRATSLPFPSRHQIYRDNVR